MQHHIDKLKTNEKNILKVSSIILYSYELEIIYKTIF